MTGEQLAGLLLGAAFVAAIGAIAWIGRSDDTADEQSAEVLASLGVRPQPQPAAYRQLQPDQRDLELWDLIDHENHRDNDSTGEDHL